MSYCVVSPLSRTFLWLIEEQNCQDVEILTKVLLPHLLCLWPLLCSGINTNKQELCWMPLTLNGKKRDEMEWSKKNELTSQKTEFLRGKRWLLGVKGNSRWPGVSQHCCCASLWQVPLTCAFHIQAGLRTPRIWPVLLYSKAPERTHVLHFKLIIAGTELLAWFRNDGWMKQAAHL